MDDWNCPASRANGPDSGVGAAHLGEKSEADRFKRGGARLIYWFLDRHPCFNFVYVHCKDRLRCNAEDWNIWDDYFAKVNCR
jgi:hypothetical protein